MSRLNSNDVARIVDQYLHKHRQLEEVGVQILEGTAERESCWYVPVATRTDPPRKFEYYDVLSEVEDEVKRDKNIDIMIVPSGTVDAR